MAMVVAVLACTALPADRADAAVVCGYVRVQSTTVPLVTLCGPLDCNGLDNPPIIVGPTETYVCVMV
jgi:hypothetical protein